MEDKTFGQVLAGTRAAVTFYDAWPLYSWAAPALVASQLGFDRNGSTGNERRSIARFDGQVGRALHALADEGRLRKAGRGTRDPRGTLNTQEASWWTPESWDAAVVARERKQAEEAETARQWAEVYDGLVSAGFHPVPVPNVPLDRARGLVITLPLAEWQQLRGELP